MEDNDKLIDQSVLAEDVANKIPYEFVDLFLVKTLDPIIVKKEFNKPVSDKPATKDENGIEAVDYDNVETEVKEVESDFKKGVVLKVPHTYSQLLEDTEHPIRMPEIKVGDVILFRSRAAQPFDLLPDAALINSYHIVALMND